MGDLHGLLGMREVHMDTGAQPPPLADGWERRKLICQEETIPAFALRAGLCVSEETQRAKASVIVCIIQTV